MYMHPSSPKIFALKFNSSKLSFNFKPLAKISIPAGNNSLPSNINLFNIREFFNNLPNSTPAVEVILFLDKSKC